MARRAVYDAGQRLQLDADAVARAEIVAVEFANNILQHAQRGTLIVGSTPGGDALQLVALDKGPGISSVDRALEDGYTTGTTPGVGLGAAGRLAQQFTVFSEFGKGTVAAATIGSATQLADPSAAVLSTSMHGETLNGDSWSVHRAGGREVYLLVDGLGHGLYASEAANVVVSMFTQTLRREPSLPLTDLLQRMHTPMHATRGAAVAVVEIDHARQTAICCGVGNVSCALCAPDGSSRSLVSHNGTLGHQMRRLQEFAYPFTPGTLLVMHSDGLSTHWKLSQYGTLARYPAAAIAGVLYRDAVRGRDDATVLVARLNAAEGQHG